LKNYFTSASVKIRGMLSHDIMRPPGQISRNPWNLYILNMVRCL